MLENVQKKVLLDLFVSPASVVPAAIGATLLMASWATGWHGWALFGGIAGLTVGAGVTATRWILGLEEMTEQAHQYALEEEHRRKNEELAKLDASLSLDGDPRTEACLRKLREHYDGFQNKLKDGKISATTYQVSSQVEQLFDVCIDQLQRSHELWEEAHAARGRQEKELLEERERIVAEVVETTRHINSAVEQFRALETKKSDNNLESLRNELDESLRVAKIADQRMAEWEDSSPKQYDESEFE